MRSIINISLPTTLALEVKKEVSSGNFASTSEFFRHLLRIWKEEQLFRRINLSQDDFKKGKFKTLKSLRDLK